MFWILFHLYVKLISFLCVNAFCIQLDSNVKEAFDVAYDNIYAFHLAQKSTEKSVENMKVSQFSYTLRS